MKKFSKFIIGILLIISLFTVVYIDGYAVTNPPKFYDEQYFTQNIPTGYYNNVNTSLTEDDFRRNLSTIISSGYVQHSYSTNNTVLKYTDPDPSGNGNAICLYTGQSIEASGSKDGQWNKEHVWAKSHGFPESNYSGSEPYSDAHHLRPTEVSINRNRSSSDFGVVDNPTHTDAYGNKWTSNLFEPRDEVKGDVARMMFYMATRYGFDGTFNLTLVDTVPTSGSSGNGKFGNLHTLLEWHYQDPVSKEEIYRNNIIYTFYQKNRNPYIDHPEYVDLAYPNDIQSSLEVDETKVTNVINLIAALPAIVTLEDKTQIDAAQTAYKALNTLEKQRITNYSKLSKCISDLKVLESGSTTPENPDIPTTQGDIAIDFNTTDGISTSYIDNVSFTASGKSLYASSAYYNRSEGLRIGSNSAKIIDSKFGLSGYGSYLEPQFDVENLSSMRLSVTNTFGTITAWYVFLKETGSNTYNQISTGSPGENKNFDVTASIADSVDGRFVIVFIGTKPRAVVSTLNLYTKSFLDFFIEEQTNSSIKLDYNKDTKEILDADLRFGIHMSKDAYHCEAKYGVIVLESSLGKEIVSGLQTNAFASEFVDSSFIVECNPVRVDGDGRLDSNGDYYQFAWVITNMEGHYADELIAVAYVEYDGKLYFSNSISSSLSSLAKEYAGSNLYDSVLNEVLKSLYQ